MGNCYIYLNTSEVTIRTFIIFEIKSFKCFFVICTDSYVACIWKVTWCLPQTVLEEESLLN